MLSLQAVVFDLDDTLYPERSYLFSGFRAVATWVERQIGIGAGQTFIQLQQLFEAGVRGKIFDRWVESVGLNPHAYVPSMVEVYRTHPPQIVPYAGAEGLLQRLRKRFRLGLLSDGTVAIQQRKLIALGLAEYFDAVVFTDAGGRSAWKPSAWGFEHVLSGLGVTPGQAVYVADNPTKDFLGARRVGMLAVRVRSPDGLYAGVEPSTPRHAAHIDIPALDRLEAALRALFDVL